jgi:hypothetical protein
MKNISKFLLTWYLWMLVLVLILTILTSCKSNTCKSSVDKDINRCMVFERENGVISVCLDEVSCNIIP